jgi:fibronectin-binding autotransporter adhesin
MLRRSIGALMVALCALSTLTPAPRNANARRPMQEVPSVSSEDALDSATLPTPARVPPQLAAPEPAAPSPTTRATSQEEIDPLAGASDSASGPDVERDAVLRAFDAVREAGPNAVLEFAAAVTNARLQALIQPEVDALLRARHPAPAPNDAPTAPLAPSAPIVGVDSSCAFDTIQQAYVAAPEGATLRIVGQTLSQTVDLNAGKAITLVGGYNATCTEMLPGSSPVTTLSVTAPGSVIDVSGGARVLTARLVISGGSSFGAGVDVLGASHVTLSATTLTRNQGASGGGIYVGGSATVTLTNGTRVFSNTASSVGGGAIVYGRLTALGTTTDFERNTAAVDGGNIAVVGGTLHLDNSDVLAGTASNRGGGIYASSQAAITLTNSVFVGESTPCCQSATDGGGIYASDSRINLLGPNTTVMRNSASGNGGGIYLTQGSYLYANNANIGNTALAANGNRAVLGGGVYAISSTIDFNGRIVNNTASSSGGGIYATQSVLTLTNVTVGGTALHEANEIDPGGLNGAGLYLINGTRATLSNTVVSSNTLKNPATGYAGGIYIRAGSALTATSSRIERNSAPSQFDGRGAGLYIYDGQVTLSDTQVLSNSAGSFGGGVRLFGASRLDVLTGSVFRANTALGAASGSGGGIAATDAADLNIAHSSFLSNRAGASGGAIYINGGTLDLIGTFTLSHNSAVQHGGAIALFNTADADLAVTGGPSSGQFISNTAGGDGGALYIANSDTVQLHAIAGQPLRFAANTAGGDGGAVHAGAGAALDMYGQIDASGNQATGNGGFAYLRGSSLRLDDYFATQPFVEASRAASGGALHATDNSRVECDGAVFGGPFSGNQATAGGGGAVYLRLSAFDAANCRFEGNRATAGDGGAIAAYTSTVLIRAQYLPAALGAARASARDALQPDAAATDDGAQATACDPLAQQCSVLRGNSVISSTLTDGNGGAIFSDGSHLTVESTALHRNTALRGGAIYQTGLTATAWLSNALVYSNTSLLSFGAGVRNSRGAITITHSTLAHNSGGAGYSPGSATSTIYNSIIWGNSVGAFGALTDAACNTDQAGVAGPAVNPLFIEPGAGENYHLSPLSPALDACDNADVARDLENNARPLGPKFDQGVYEQTVLRVRLPLVQR